MFMNTPLAILLNDKGHTVHSITPTKTVYDAILEMKRLGIGALMVLEHEHLQGMISERDVVLKFIGCACDPATTPISEIMSTNLTTVTPDTTVQQAMRIVTEKRVRHLPVLDNGKLIGLISIGDLTRWVMLSQEHDITALTGYIRGER